MFEAEKIARSLFSEIKKHFNNSLIKPAIDLIGEGVHWHCIVAIDSCKVSIWSFDISYQPEEQGKTEEFIASYFQKEKEVSCGRTSNREKLIHSIAEWLNHPSKERLHNAFDFVDHDFRMVQSMESDWIKDFPELSTLSRALEHQGSGIIRYELSNNNRSCVSTGVGDRGDLYFQFFWDECPLFETEAVREETAEVLKRYLIDREAPSSLNKEFSWIPTNSLTDSHEKGNRTEGEFIESWKSIVRFYEGFPQTSLPEKDQILQLLHALKKQGFEKTIRTGQSATTLILSRSKRHGLRKNQRFLAFEFRNNTIHLTTENGHCDSVNGIRLHPKLILLLKELEKTSIN